MVFNGENQYLIRVYYSVLFCYFMVLTKTQNDLKRPTTSKKRPITT